MTSQAVRSRKPLRPSRIAVVIAMTLVAIVMLYPFYFMVSASFQSPAQFEAGSGHSLASWPLLFQALPVARQMLNSTLICVAAIAVIVLVATLGGFAFAKLAYRGSRLMFVGVIAAMMIPVQSIIIPAYVNFSHIHLINNYQGVIIMYAALGTPFATFLMTAFYRGLPDELIEAGVVDGLGFFGVFRRIALPLSSPAVVTIAVLQFIQIWDDLLVGLLFLNDPNKQPITVGLGALASGRVINIPALMVGSVLSALPAIVVYLVFQRSLISGLTAGIGK